MERSVNDTKGPLASVVITSRNRKQDLLEAIGSCLRQTVPVEVIYFDDASEDGSPAAVASRFPEVRIFVSESRVGYVVLRNRAAALAETNYIFSLDDDAVFASPCVVEQTLADFDDPRIGAVAIPFKNVHISDTLLQRAPRDDGIYVTCTFVGTAHALRRDVFLQVGGYKENLVQQGEEADYCIRMLEAGYFVRLGRSDLIHHFVSPKRDLTRLHYYGTRNYLLFYWRYADPLRLPFYLASSTGLTMLQALRALTRRQGDEAPDAPAANGRQRDLRSSTTKTLPAKLRAIRDAHLAGATVRRAAQPVSAGTFRLFCRLSRRPAELSLVLGRHHRGSPARQG